MGNKSNKLSQQQNSNDNSVFQQQNISSNTSSNTGSTGNNFVVPLNIKPQDSKKETVAVIVTISEGGSYDRLFEQVEQRAEEGTKVLVYKCSSYAIKAISKAFDGEYENDSLKEMIKEINSVDKDCVVFNWECCGHYSSETFGEGSKDLFTFVKKLVDIGYMCMFSDFSLKALVKNWDEKVLGPNPFQKIGQTSAVVQLRFKSGQLKQCPSAQLQIVGEMAEQGKVNVHTLGGTIMYSVNKKNLNHDKYKLQVLTVAANMNVNNQNLKCKIGEFEGAAGHVLVKYPSGGTILVSMTHWIELMKVDTSQQKLFEVAARQYGQSYAQQQKMQYDVLDEAQKTSWRANKATQFIHNQAPCTNMKKKARM